MKAFYHQRKMRAQAFYHKEMANPSCLPVVRVKAFYRAHLLLKQSKNKSKLFTSKHSRHLSNPSFLPFKYSSKLPEISQLNNTTCSRTNTEHAVGVCGAFAARARSGSLPLPIFHICIVSTGLFIPTHSPYKC